MTSILKGLIENVIQFSCCLTSQLFAIFIIQQVCKKEEERGHKLLQPLAGMFVSNSNEDIRIELSALEPGWKIKGSKVKVTKHQILEMVS